MVVSWINGDMFCRIETNPSGTTSTGLAQTSSRGSLAAADISTPEVVVARGMGSLAPGLVKADIRLSSSPRILSLVVPTCKEQEP